VLQELSWLVTAGPVGWRDARWADVCIVVSPAFSGALLGAVMARLSVPAHLHVHDVVPDIAVESGQLRSPLARRVAIGVAGWTYGSYRSISVLSEGMRQRLGTYVDDGTTTVRVIPNWVRNRTPGDSPRSGQVPFASYAVFAGSLGQKQGLSGLTQAAGVLATRGGPGIVVLGDGPGRQRVQQGAANLTWLGLVDEAEYNAVLSHALAGIVTLQPGVGDSIVPSKLVAYMASGLPVIVSADPGSEAAQLVRSVGCGMTVLPERGDLLADAVAQMAEDPAERRAMGARGEAYASTVFARERCIDMFEQAVMGLVSKRPERRRPEAQTN
jgi:colanic acid biosynthesis glycosyl transferase WcaI